MPSGALGLHKCVLKAAQIPACLHFTHTHHYVCTDSYVHYTKWGRERERNKADLSTFHHPRLVRLS